MERDPDARLLQRSSPVFPFTMKKVANLAMLGKRSCMSAAHLHFGIRALLLLFFFFFFSLFFLSFLFPSLLSLCPLLGRWGVE